MFFFVCSTILLFRSIIFLSMQVETIGDAYMAAGGLHRKDEEHARRAITLGLNMISIAEELRTPARGPIQV